MDRSTLVGDRDRLARTLSAAVLAVVALSSLRKGKRLSGALAGVGAVVLGYAAKTRSPQVGDRIGVERDGADVELRCANCGDPIVPGQRRRPNADDEIVHEACSRAAG